MREDGPGPRAPVEPTVQNKRAVRAILEACGFRTGDEVRRAVERVARGERERVCSGCYAWPCICDILVPTP